MADKKPFYPKILDSDLNSKNKPASPKIINSSMPKNTSMQNSRPRQTSSNHNVSYAYSSSLDQGRMLRIGLAVVAAIIAIVIIIVSVVSCNRNNKNNDGSNNNDTYNTSSINHENMDFFIDSSIDNEETNTETPFDEEIVEETIIDEDGSVIVVPHNNSNNSNSNNDSGISVDGNISSNQVVKTSKNGSTLSVDKTSIEKRRGRFYEKGEYLLYSFSPKYDGSYRFDISAIDEGLTICIMIKNYDLENVTSTEVRNDPDGVSANLSAGKKYFIEISADEGKGNFEFSVGRQKQSIDINAYSSVKDSIQFKNQENIYKFTAEREGVYRFDIGEMPEGLSVYIDLYNSVMERLSSTWCSSVGDGITYNLKKGQKVYVVIIFQERFGNYRLDIGRQTPTVDATNLKSLESSVSFKTQTNLYYFKAPLDGTYRFEVSYIPEGLDIYMNIYNSVMELQINNYISNKGEGITYELKKGQVIYISINQEKGFGKCRFDIHKPNPQKTVYLNQTISGKIDFYDQENVYKFTAPVTGTYKFTVTYISKSFTYTLSSYDSQNEYICGSDFSYINGSYTLELNKGDLIYLKSSSGITGDVGSYSIIITMT